MKRVIPLAGFLVLLVFAYLTAIKLAYALVYAIVLAAGVSWFWARAAGGGLRLRREGPVGAYQVGETFTETLRVDNTSRVGLPWVEVIDRSAIAGYDAGRVVSIESQKHRQWRSKGRFMARGRYQLGPTELVAGDPFGLFQRTVKVPPQSSVLIYPRLVDIGRLLPGAWHTSGEFFGQGRHTDAPPDVFGIREHDLQDGFNRIHWPSTARLGRLISKSFEKLEGSDVMIVLDLQQRAHRGKGTRATVECAVSLAASIAVEVLNRGQSVGLRTNDHSMTTIRAGRGAAQLNQILEFLAVAQPDGVAPVDSLLDAVAGPRDFQSLVLVTPSADAGLADRLVQTARGWKRRTSVFHIRDDWAPVPGLPAGAAFGVDQLSWWSFTVDDPVFAPDPVPAPPAVRAAAG